jgi:hypothetical protein
VILVKWGGNGKVVRCKRLGGLLNFTIVNPFTMDGSNFGTRRVLIMAPDAVGNCHLCGLPA